MNLNIPSVFFSGAPLKQQNPGSLKHQLKMDEKPHKYAHAPPHKALKPLYQFNRVYHLTQIN